MFKASLAAIGFITALTQIAGAAERLADVPAKSLKGIRISGFKGNLNFIGLDADPEAKTAKPSANLTIDATSKSDDADWKPVVENIDGWIQISIQGPSSKSDWRNLQIPAVDLDVRGPSVPLILTWKEGDLTIKNWKASANLTHHDGKILSEGGQAAFKITAQQGDVTVNGHTGRFSLDNYNAKVSLKAIEGGMSLENFSGNLNVDSSKGEISLKTGKGKSQIVSHKGGIDFDLSQGEILISGLEGPIRGQAESGQVTAEIKGTPDLKIRGEAAKVSVLVPKTSGARVDLGTQDGNFSIAFPLKYDRVDKFKLMKGSLAGSGGGSVFVRTKSGDIRLKALSK